MTKRMRLRDHALYVLLALAFLALALATGFAVFTILEVLKQALK